MTETSGVVPPDQVGAGDWMAKAIAMAQTARRCVSPRPWVGAVLVTAAGRWFAGATDGRTGPHAEIVALSNARAAGIDPAGATMYVTLEPCAHHGQTPPCADALVEAGIRRVVVAITDPDPQVSGRGIERLRAAGIDVEIGPGSEQVRGQLAPYLKHRRTGQPYVVLKLAATLDGRIAAPDGSGRWITGPQARLDAHRLRADSDAILVGAGTVRADDPSLTVRLPEGEEPGSEPLRVVLGSVPAKAAVQPALAMAGPLDEVLTELGARGVLQLMVEGGASVAHAFHHAGLVDRYVVYVAPALFGGDDAKAMFAGPGAPTITDLWRGRIDQVRQLGPDLRIDVVPGTQPAHEGGEVGLIDGLHAHRAGPRSPDRDEAMTKET